MSPNDTNEDSDDVLPISNPLMIFSIVLNALKMLFYILLIIYHIRIGRLVEIRKTLSIEMILAASFHVISYYLSYFNNPKLDDEKVTPLCKFQGFLGMFTQFYFSFILCMHSLIGYQLMVSQANAKTSYQVVLFLIRFIIPLALALFLSGIFNAFGEKIYPDILRYCKIEEQSKNFQKITFVCYFGILLILFYIFYFRLKAYVIKLKSSIDIVNGEIEQKSEATREKAEEKLKNNIINSYLKELRKYSFSALFAAFVFLTSSVCLLISLKLKHDSYKLKIISLVASIIEIITYPLINYIFSGATLKDLFLAIKCWEDVSSKVGRPTAQIEEELNESENISDMEL